MLIKNIGVIGLLLLSTLGVAMESELDTLCAKDLQYYKDNYHPSSEKGGRSSTERWEYLDSLPKKCNDHVYAIVFRSEVLFKEKKFRESLNELERGISLQKLDRKGNLYYWKASSLMILKQSDIDVDESYDDIIALLGMALKFENDLEELIHLRWAEVAYEQRDYETSYEHIELGFKINEFHRFRSLGIMITEKLGDYPSVLDQFNELVKIRGEEVLKEPDTVLAVVKSLCHTGQKEEAYAFVYNAQQAKPDFKGMPEMVEAARLVTQDPTCKK